MSLFTAITSAQLRRGARFAVAAGLGSAAIVACTDERPGPSPQTAPAPLSSTTEVAEESEVTMASTRIRFTVGTAEATATLRDNPTARDFVSLLPLTINMHDLLGREKPGQLPRELNEDGEHQFTYEVGDVAYWPPLHDIALFYGDDGQRTIPSPGIIVLGTIDSGLDEIASAGDDFHMTIEALN
jgi:hypothetical protein